MLRDAFGLELGTDSAAALAAYDAAVRSYLEFRLDAIDHGKAMLEADPECAMAHCLRGFLLTGLQSDFLAGKVGEAVAAAEARAARATPRERLMVEALRAVHEGDPARAEAVLLPRHRLEEVARLQIARIDVDGDRQVAAPVAHRMDVRAAANRVRPARRRRVGRVAPQRGLPLGYLGVREIVHHLQPAARHAERPPGAVVVVNRGALAGLPDHGRQDEAPLRVPMERMARVARIRGPQRPSGGRKSPEASRRLRPGSAARTKSRPRSPLS